jgi:uncharacterized integral membrane protein
MWMLKWLGIALLLILLLGFSMLNLDQRVNIDLLLWQFQDVPLILVIFEAFIIGMLIWFLIAFVNELKLRGELRALTRDRDEVSRELLALRNQPLEELEEEEGSTEDHDD